MGVEGTAMQRIRYGLTGLAFVFLMVLIGTAVIRSGDETSPNQASAVTRDQPSEPLAELGVAPGEGSDNEGQANVGQPARR
jgi:hypothetical protein